MRLLAVLVLLSLGLAPEVMQSSVGQSKPDPFAVGLMRSDGVLIPFAQYDGHKWLNPWPSARDASKDEPSTIADLSKPWFVSDGKSSPAWYIWWPKGTLHVLKPSKIVQVESHCEKEWGLTTELPQDLKKTNRDGIIGIAADKKREIDPVSEIDDKAEEWSKLSSFILSTFSRQEEIQAADLSAFLPPPSQEERKAVSPTLSHLFRGDALITDQSLYYFEALKQYQKPIPGNDQSCNDLFFRGWILRDTTGSLKPVTTTIGWTDCEKTDNTIPLATLSLDHRIFVFALDLGYEGESYSIFELKNSEIELLLETAGGSC
jgi:hypothetical protein